MLIGKAEETGKTAETANLLPFSPRAIALTSLSFVKKYNNENRAFFLTLGLVSACILRYTTS